MDRNEYKKEWRRKNKEKIKAYNRTPEYRKKGRERAKRRYPETRLKHLERKNIRDNFRKNKSCIECGYKKHPEILEFHHRNPKEKIKQVSEIYNKEMLNNEIKKCDLLCPNCHRLIHQKNA